MSLLIFSITALVHAQAGPAKNSSLMADLNTLARAHHGQVSLYARNLRTGETVGIRPDLPVQTASVIKITILFAAMEQVRSDQVRLTDLIVLRKQDQVGGSGVLQLLDTPIELTLRDVLTLMIDYSDNTATNLAIEKLGLARINQETRSLGLGTTYLFKEVFKPATEPMPADQKIYGLGKTTAREMVQLLDRIYTCRFAGAAKPGDRALCEDMLTMLQKQSFRNGIPRLLEKNNPGIADAALGNKTGSLDAVRNDVAILATKGGPVLLAVFTFKNVDQSWSNENEAETTIARIADCIVRNWSPAGLDPRLYKPASESREASAP